MSGVQHLRHVIFVTFTAAAASCISLIGGIGLEAIAERILPLIPLLIALPALNTVVGDYAAIIAAHAADPSEQKNTKRKLAGAISKTIWINIIGVIILSLLLAWQRGYLLDPGFAIKFGIFITFALLTTISAMFLMTTVIDKLLARSKLGSDDILIPIVTSISDVLMLSLVTAAVLLVF